MKINEKEREIKKRRQLNVDNLISNVTLHKVFMAKTNDR